MSRKKKSERDRPVRAQGGPQAATPTAPARGGSQVGVIPWGLNLQFCLLLAVVTAVLYSTVGGHPFLNYDDESYVTKNVHVQAGLTWRTVAWAFTSTDLANWHPITWLSHALDVELFGEWPGGHHLHSLLLHVVNVILLYSLLVRVTGFRWRSLFVAALFAIHPINVESVAWVAERKNVLSTLFFLLALGAYGRYAQKPSALRYLWVAALFVLGIAAKPMLVTLPFVLLLLDYWPLQRIQGWIEPSPTFSLDQKPWPVLILEKLPLLAVSAGSAAITLMAQSPTAIASASDLSLETRIGNAIFSYGTYLLKLFWPVNLAPIYPHLGKTLPALQILLSGFFLLGISAVAWYFRRSRPFFISSWLWYLGTLVPVIGLVQVGVQSMADRYAYIPFIGLYIAAVWGCAQLAEDRKLEPQLCAGAVVAGGILFIVSWQQVQYWKSPQNLWSHTLAVTKNNYIAEDNMGTALLRMGNIEALAHFQNASRISPNDPISHGALAGYLQDQGQFREAIAYYQIAIRNNSDPDILALTEANLAILYRQTGDYEKGREYYRLAAKASPDSLEEMINDLSRQLAYRPAARGFLRLGLLYDVANRLPQARAAYEQALRLEPGLEDAQKALVSMR